MPSKNVNYHKMQDHQPFSDMRVAEHNFSPFYEQDHQLTSIDAE